MEKKGTSPGVRQWGILKTVIMTMMTADDSHGEKRNIRYGKRMSEESSAPVDRSTAIRGDCCIFCFFDGWVTFSVATFRRFWNVKSLWYMRSPDDCRYQMS